MISISSPGGYENLEFKALKDGEFTEGANVVLSKIPEEDLVVVKTFACGVNYADICIRWGLYESAKQYVGWPITPGFEFSGKIISKGSKVHDFEIGQCVFGVSLFGGYSEVIRVPQHQIFPLPEKLDRYEAAGFPTVSLTAWYAMMELARPRPGSWVLVHSAAGGVGSTLIQLAKIAGCQVVGVIGASHKAELVQQLGCEHVIDKSKESLWQRAEEISPNGYDAVFDANGVATVMESYNHLSPGGKLVVYGFHTMLPRSDANGSGSLGILNWLKIGWNYLWTPRFNPLEMTNNNKSVMAFNLSFMFSRMDILKEAMTQLIKWVDNGVLRVGKVSTYPLQGVGQAHRDLESGQTVGKLVLTMDNEKEL